VTDRRVSLSWNSVTTGLAAIATLLLVRGWLLLSGQLGIAVAFVGAAGPFWIMNAS